MNKLVNGVASRPGLCLAGKSHGKKIKQIIHDNDKDSSNAQNVCFDYEVILEVVDIL